MLCGCQIFRVVLGVGIGVVKNRGVGVWVGINVSVDVTVCSIAAVELTAGESF